MTMLSKEGFEIYVKDLYTGQFPSGEAPGKLRVLLAHDAEQRRVIGLLRKELALLKQDDAERFTLIRDMEQEERRKDREIEQARRTAEYWKAEHLAGNKKIEQQEQQIATLKSELSQRTNLEGSAPCWNSAHMQQIATLREALERIVDLLGECRLDHHGNCQEHFISDLCEVKQAQQALKEHP